jgi:maltooligosyltrehalose synthase
MKLVVDNALPIILSEIVGVVQSIAAAGAVNGLAQMMLRLTAPGLLDLYQGCDYWDLSLVDPDNRRPVDFAPRMASLGKTDLADALATWRDGRIKQVILARTLALRRALPALFAEGAYRPVKVDGAMAAHVVAFERSHGDDRVLVVVPRLPGRLLAKSGTLALDPASWQGATLQLPGKQALYDVLDDGRSVSSEHVALQQFFIRLPVGLFSTKLP